MNEERIIITDDNGQEIEMEVLFTFDSDQTEKQYVLYFDPAAEDGQVYVSTYTAEGDLNPIEDESEWEMINEVFETFMASEETHDHDHDHDHDHHHHDHDHDHPHEH